jgi:hypothetical protein
MNAAVPNRSNLLRLEHRLQTVVDGDVEGRRDTAKPTIFGEVTLAARAARICLAP